MLKYFEIIYNKTLYAFDEIVIVIKNFEERNIQNFRFQQTRTTKTTIKNVTLYFGIRSA